MKKSFLFICALAAAILLAGCQNEINNEEVDLVEATHSVVFTAEKMIDTKTAIASEGDGIVSYKWIEGDEARMYITESYQNGDNVETNVGTVTQMTLTNDDKTATFNVTFDGDAPAGTLTYRAVYAGRFSTTEAHNPLIPEAQAPLEDSFDPAADVMVSDDIVLTARDANPTFRFYMNRKVSVNKMTLKGLGQNEKVKSVTFQSDKFHSAYYIVSSNSYNGEKKKLTLTFTQNNTVPASGEFPVYFTTAPVENASFIVTVVTDQKRYVKESSREISFNVGEVRRFNVTMPEGVVIDRIEGDYLIGSYVGGEWHLMSHGLGSNPYYLSVSTGVTKEASSVEYLDFSNVADINNYQWRVEAYGEGYSIRNIFTSNYLYYYPGPNPSNEANASSELSEHTCFNVLVTNKLATIQSRENTSRVLRYNSGSNPTRFAFYGGTQNDIYLIPVYDDGLTSVTLSFADSEINTNTTDCVNVTGQTVTVSPDESVITNAITYTISGDPIGSINTSTGVVSLNGTAGTATVTATFPGDAIYRTASASYTITVAQVSPIMYKIVTSLNGVTEGTYVIVNDGYYLPNAAATSSGPVKNNDTRVTIEGDYVINVSDDMTWEFSGTTSAMTIKSTIEGNYYLVISGNSNSSVRVNKTSDHKWTISPISGSSAYSLKDNTQNRYCATYSAGSDWRSYETYSHSNYGDEGKVYLYKQIDNRSDAPINWSADSGNATWSSEGLISNLPTLTNSEGLTVTYASSNTDVATIASDGTVTIVGGGNTTISATYTATPESTYKTTTASYTLTVTDNRTQVATPTFSPIAGEVDPGTTVSITSATTSATIYYTTGSSDFSAGDWTEYTNPIEVNATCTIKAIATAANYKNSDVATATYTISGGTESVCYTLAPVATGSNSSPHNNYSAAATTTINNIGWSVMGNSSMVPWRIGGKSISEVDREIYSTTALSDNITKIEITHGAASSITIHSMTVVVSKNADFSNPISTLTATFTANNTVTVERPSNISDWSNCYFKFVYNVTVSGNSNKYFEFTQAVFYSIH